MSDLNFPDRRAVLRAAVWTAPVILVAVATPSAAASTDPRITIAFAPDGTNYQAVFTNRTGTTLQAGTVTVRVSPGFTYANSGTGWLYLGGQSLTFANEIDIPTGTSSSAIVGMDRLGEPVNVTLEATAGSYSDTDTVILS